MPAFAGMTRVEALSPPAEQALDVGELQLHIGRAAVVALARVRRRLHLAQERVHLLGREPAARRAREPWQAMVASTWSSLRSSGVAGASSASSSATSRTRPATIGLAEERGRLAHRDRAGAEGLDARGPRSASASRLSISRSVSAAVEDRP